jgi:hypothetical protein
LHVAAADDHHLGRFSNIVEGIADHDILGVHHVVERLIAIGLSFLWFGTLARPPRGPGQSVSHLQRLRQPQDACTLTVVVGSFRPLIDGIRRAMREHIDDPTKAPADSAEVSTSARTAIMPSTATSVSVATVSPVFVSFPVCGLASLDEVALRKGQRARSIK